MTTPPRSPSITPRGDRRSPTEQTLPGIGRLQHPEGKELRADVFVTPLDSSLLPFWAAAEEVSHQGVFIRTRRLPREDALLLLELVFPDLSVPKLRLDAHVVHRIPGAGFGCRFVAVPAKVSSRLSELIAYRAAAPRYCF
ncbi:MAG: PilZ domain-containing protein [Deltaproteobacteria bacterium]|nr:PilZ domain-containing protein [Deltaproteobacteria bacterium]